MSSKGGRSKRTKHVRNLDCEKALSLAQTLIDQQNIIVSGRQLHRTPPSKSEKVTILQQNDSPTSEKVVKEEPCAQEISPDISCNGTDEVHQHPKVKDERMSIRRSSLTVASATIGNADSEVFIQGMQGYQWTDTDLEFVNLAKRKKQVQQLQQELSDVQKSLNSMRQVRDKALTAHDKIQADLSKVLSCEWIQQISKEILLRSQSSRQLDGLDLKALLAKLKVADVLCTTSEKKTEVSKLKIEVEKAEAVREKEEQLMKDIETCEKNISQSKVTVRTLTADIAALESQLSNKQVAPQSAKPRQKDNKGPKPSAPTKSSKPTGAHKPSKTPPPKTFKSPAAPPAHKPSKTPPPPKTSKSPPPAPKPSKAPAAPKPSKTLPAPKPSKSPPPAPKPSKAPAAPKPSKTLPAPKPSKSPHTAPKPSKTLPPTPRFSESPPLGSKPSKSPAAPKPSTSPLPSPKPSKTLPSANKPSKSPPLAPKPFKTPAAPSAPKTSKPPANLKVSKTAKASKKPTTGQQAPEGDVESLRRSKRIAAKKEK